MDKVNAIVDDKLFSWMREIRRTIHQWPETAFEEHKTAQLICEKLSSLGIEYKDGIAGTGVAGKLLTKSNAPTIALRADMDALPIEENTGLPFSSKVCGKMHACGHDGHVAILLGAAALLKKNPPEGNVIFIFQPAEEGDGGAKPMIEQGVLKGVDLIFGGHIELEHKAGVIALKRGYNSAATDVLEVNITGRGGHAARPHRSVDALLIACQMVDLFQTIISRKIDPVHPAVISIGVLQAGTAHNAVAEKALLKGAIRTTEPSTREKIREEIEKAATSLSSLHGAEIVVKIESGFPPLYNHERECDFALKAAEVLLGSENVVTISYPGLGGEDFAYYTGEIPGAFVRLGASLGEGFQGAQHSPEFNFDEEVLKVGAAYYAELARYVLDQRKQD